MKKGEKMDFTELKIGMKMQAEETVTERNTALALGSGSLAVYGTPAMSCLMERAAAELAEKYLPEGWTSVGISLQIQHKAPTPTGMLVRAEAEITGVDGRKITYEVRAFDAQGEIGSGNHERFIVEGKKFQEKADGKRQPS